MRYLAVYYVTLAVGCASGATHEENVLVASSYAAELDACVAAAHTLAESQACRCTVNQHWKRPCTPTVGDAGHE